MRDPSRRVLLVSLMAMVVLIFVETQGERLGREYGWLAKDRGEFLAEVSRESEGNVSFLSQELVGADAVFGFSAAYFVVFPVLVAMVGVAAWKRRGEEFRVFATATLMNGAVSIVFFAVAPVIERWALSGADAVLLSDRASGWFIKAIRPVSGINACFPSTHASLTCLCVTICLVYGLRFRWTALITGIIVVLSTIALGIHWIPDIVAGMSLGVASVAVALRMNGRAKTVVPESETLQGAAGLSGASPQQGRQEKAA
jgi:membrane-associated phospholipid phosphatase